MQTFDAVMVGGGHNGLVCATYLAKAGLNVCVLERRDVVGGAAVSEEVWPGYTVSVASYWMSMLQPKIMLDLDLKRHGLEVIEPTPAFHPFDNGQSIVFWPETERMVEEIRQFSERDAEAYPEFKEHLDRLAPYLRRLLFETPVDPSTGRLTDIWKTISLLWRYRDVGHRLYDIWDLLTLSANDYLQRWFVSDEVLAAFGNYVSGAAGTIGPKTQGSAYVLARPILRDPNTQAGPGGMVKGGMGAVSQSLYRAATEAGVTVLTGRDVEKIEVDGTGARAVKLANNERIEGDLVVCNASAKTLFLNMIDREWLDERVVSAARRIRTKSIAFKVNLAASELPKWTAFESRETGFATPGSVTLAENLDELEDAFHSALQGNMAEKPYLWVTTPSAFDPSLTPEGQHVLHIMGGHVPYHLQGRQWDDEAREELYDLVIRQICRYAPGFDKSVTHKQILVPPDIESLFSMPDGHVHHGEMSIDQVFVKRPFAHNADYRTPISRLYLCGASTHPGGGVSGIPGHNAAREILKDIGVKKHLRP